MPNARWALVVGLVVAFAALIQVVTAWLTLGLAEESSQRIGAGKMLWLGIATFAAAATTRAGSRLRILPLMTGVLVVVSLASILFGTIGDANEVYGVELLVSFFAVSVLLGRLSR